VPPDGFSFAAAPISVELAARMTPTSWRPGCPVGLEDLRYLSVAHWGFDGAVHVGELVVHADVVADLEGIFGDLFAAGFPIWQMRLVDDFGGDDFTSIEADNTSAFNCRPVEGGSGWSNHAYGRAIDVNPIENPYVYADGTTSHAASVPYLDRSTVRPGMVVEGSAAVAAFDARGWDWGGRWWSPVDHQHFSSTGG
jgi:poly-gamma-glutamate synthesis protein (capsule biosynthesis protein)